MEYKGYIGHVEYDNETDIFHGEVINTRDVITFQGNSTRELKKALKDSVKIYLDYCKKKEREPDKPFSGNVLIRSTPERHRSFYIAAKVAGKSLNRWITDTLVRAAKKYA